MHVQLKHNSNQNGAERVKRKIDDCKKISLCLLDLLNVELFFKSSHFLRLFKNFLFQGKNTSGTF